MRWNLLKTYDKIYVLDLHGNTTKQETCPDGSPDVNVFDIMQGVSINILVKNGKKKKDELAEVLHYDLYGKREEKYSFLLNNEISSVPYSLLRPKAPRYYMIPFDFAAQGSYDEGILLSELFGNNNMGITSGDDDNRVAFAPETLSPHFEYPEKVKPISYRPFDRRHIYYDPNILARARFDFMTNLNNRDNLAITAIGQSRVGKVLTPLIASGLIDKSIVSSVDNTFIFPLYTYPREDAQQTLDGRTERVPNLNSEIVERMAAAIGLTFVAEKCTTTPSAEAAATPPQTGGELSESGSPPVLGGVDGLPGRGGHVLNTFAPIDILELHLHDSTAFADIPREIQRVFEDRLSARAVSERCRNILADCRPRRRTSPNPSARIARSREIHHRLSGRRRHNTIVVNALLVRTGNGSDGGS